MRREGAQAWRPSRPCGPALLTAAAAVVGQKHAEVRLGDPFLKRAADARRVAGREVGGDGVDVPAGIDLAAAVF